MHGQRIEAAQAGQRRIAVELTQQGFHRRVLEHGPRDHGPPHGGDREVVAPRAAPLPEFGDERVVGERVEREFEALKLGAGLDIVPGKEHTGFGCHDGFLREQDLVLQSFCHSAPAPSRTGRPGAPKKCGNSACPKRWRPGWSRKAANPESDTMRPVSDRTGVRITPFRVKKN